MSTNVATSDTSSNGGSPLHRRGSSQTFCTDDTGRPCDAFDCDMASLKSQNSDPDDGGKDISMRERWSACLESMRQHDETMVKRWNDDIDSLLVFAGLFSAILTAFTIEFYRRLQYDPDDTTVLLLQQISLQLATLGSSTSQNFTLQSFASPNSPFNPPNHAVRMNATWFAALVCSLVAALIGILAKQWLREYTMEISSSPQESVRIRQFRHDGLTKWHVAKIIGFVPILLEIALVLFLHGLLELLWSLNNTVAGVSTAITSVSLSFYIGTMVVPSFSPNSPFKAPQAWAFCVAVWKVARLRKYFSSYSKSNIPFDLARGEPSPPLPSSWADREVEFGRLVASELDRRALAMTYKRSLDDDFLDIVSPCINDLQADAAVCLVFEVIARRGECSVQRLLESVRNPNGTFGLERFMLKAGGRGTRRLMRMILDILPRMLNDGVRSKITILDMLFVLRKLLTEAERAICQGPLHRRALDTLASLIDERGSYHVRRSSLDILWEMTQFGCNMDYCPNGIQNVIFYARDAHARNDHDTFVRACGVLLGRLPATQSPAPNQQRQIREWSRHWLRDLEQYFRTRKHRRLRFDAGIRTKWCSGLAAVAGKEKGLIQVELIVLLEEGVKLGLVDCDLEEGDALHQLRHAHRLTAKIDSNSGMLESDISDFEITEEPIPLIPEFSGE